MVDLLDFNKLNEKDFFILKVLHTKDCSIREIALESDKYLDYDLFRSIKKLMATEMVTAEKVGREKVLSSTGKGRDNYTYYEMIKEVVW